MVDFVMFVASSYMIFRCTIFYYRDNLTMDKVYDAQFSKEKTKQLLVGTKAQVEGLVFCGRTWKRNFDCDVMCGSKTKNSDKIYSYCKKGAYQI